MQFSHILCTAENGLLLYAEEPGAISGVTFDSVSLRLRRATDGEAGFHDLRPCAGPTSTERRLCYVYERNAGAVFRKCAFHAEGEMARLLELSYPTVRNRLDDILARIAEAECEGSETETQP